MKPKDLLRHLWADMMERQSSSVYINRGRRRDLTYSFNGIFLLFDGIIPNSVGKQVEREYEQRDLIKSCVVHPLRFYPPAISLFLQV